MKKTEIPRKILIMFAVLLMLLAVISFSGVFNFTKEETQEQAEVVVGLSIHFTRDDYSVSVVKAFEEKMENAKIKTIVVDAEGDSKKQVADIESLIDQGVEAIGICPLDETVVRNSLIEAQKKGIKIVTITEVPGLAADVVVEGREYDNGFGVGQVLAKKISSGGKVVILDFPYDLIRMKERIRGVKAALEQTGIEVVDGGRPATNEETMDYIKNLLEEDPGVQGIFAPYSNQLIGAGAACKALERKDIVVVGVDADLVVINLIRDGWIEAAAAQFPTLHGNYCAKAILELLESDDCQKTYGSPYMLVTRENAVEAARDLWGKDIR